MTTREGPAPIGALPSIGRPATAALLHAGVTTLTEAASMGRRRLLTLHGVGPKAVGILEAAAAEHGIAFAP